MRTSDTSLTKSLIENIHDIDLNMEEKGLGVYNYFKTKGITLSAKEIASKLGTIKMKIIRKENLVFAEKKT